jgi:hypothetical protein
MHVVLYALSRLRPRPVTRSGKSIYLLTYYKYYIYRYLSSNVGIALSPTCVAHVDWNGGLHIALSIPTI